MSWLGGFEIVTGAGMLALAVFLVGFFRLAPGADAAPSAMRLSIIPVVILTIAVLGISLVLTGLGLV